MITPLKDCMRWLTPFGLIERHRRRFQMNRLGLAGTEEVADAVHACHYELWPTVLRKPVTPWALVDVGANEGSFLGAVQTLVPLSAVYAFEPQDECQASLRAAVSQVANGLVYQAAVGDHCGEIDLICTRNTKLSSVLRPTGDIARHYSQTDFHLEKTVTVPVMRLDDVIPADAPIGLVKIDVQGYELPVLHGAVKR